MEKLTKEVLNEFEEQADNREKQYSSIYKDSANTRHTVWMTPNQLRELVRGYRENEHRRRNNYE